ncbi:toll/interleukin-1 receptor domain-containing protein [Rhodanobacter glycinis]|uniref:Toll/interleukin-1 receptor domain-containing protein n=1 Tax=Rhodanobacter glycinis TaxID=582702 RepID=A0A502CEM9_9GAMM|nr:toll/interleukin-1 receptor domain-containing protein [Rhodanobacter glycinis]TPG11110.1 toll/interleukin-1 receptor domain-containing protein [Rhodanobacter glycinis]TPG48598.1 toll/interleukin-1 receptor domain-containing protein [Rhodanobacter glycinis]
MAHDLFVSYSQPDREAAFTLVQRLEARGISVWIAPRDVSPAADWAAEIIDAISSARLMVLVFSGSSNDSGQVRREVERAVHKQLPILPFRIEDVLPSRSLEYFLSAQHWMDAFPPPLQPHIDRLCDYLDTTMGGHAAHDLPTGHRPSRDTGPADITHPTGVDAAHLRLLEVELARRIGPVAGHLVRRAAQSGGDLDVIAQRLATEIDGKSERRLFLEACWRIGKGT